MKKTALLLSLFWFSLNLNAQFSKSFVSPQQTDAEIDLRTEPYVIYHATQNQKNKLLVFLPGTYGISVGYTTFMEHAASNGFDVIGLNYPNSISMAELCNGTTDLKCHEKGRKEIILGEDLHHELEINFTNSIHNRIDKLLDYLVKNRTNENWSTYYINKGVIWDKILVSGHSQGAGHAALLSKLHKVDRAILFAGMDFDAGTVSSWQSENGETDPENLYGFTHLRDPGFFVGNPPLQIRVWSALGMDSFGELINTDTANVLTLSSRMLCSDIESVNGNYHGGLVVNSAIPKNAQNQPVYLKQWEYLLGISENSSVTEINNHVFKWSWESDVLKLNTPNNAEIKVFEINGKLIYSGNSKETHQIKHIGRELLILKLIQNGDEFTIKIQKN